MIVAVLLATAQLAAPPAVTVTIPSDVVLSLRGDGPAVTLTAESGGAVQQMPVRSVDQALAIFADVRLAPLWPTLAAAAGADLVALRDAQVADAMANAGGTRRATTTAASAVRPPVRAALAMGEALWAAGRRDEAETVVATVRGTAPGKGDWGRAEWTMTSIRLANMRQEAGDTGGALAILAAAEAPVVGSPYAINFGVNRAAYLAETGRAAEALAAIDAAEGRFAGTGNGRRFKGGEKVPGSDRQFAWIRACALARLGRADEAARAAVPLFPASEPNDRHFVIEPTAELRRRLARCTGDVAAGARAYAESLALEPVAGKALLELQPALRHSRIDPAYMAAVRAHPLLAPVLATRLRVLPPELEPALNGWVATRN